MTQNLQDLITELRSLSCSDFDDMNEDARGIERLREICDRALQLDSPSEIFKEFFFLMERLPDSELGTPGPLVHTMEKYKGHYEKPLTESIHRKPTNLSVWMINRIVNSGGPEKGFWMDLLALSSKHPEATETTRDEALDFIKFQTR